MSGPDWAILEAAAEAKYGLPSGVLRVTRMKETGGRDIPGKPTKHGTAQGFYQSMPDTVAKYGFNPHDPASAVDGTARLWADNFKASGGDVKDAARRYNGSGPDARAYADDFMSKYGGGAPLAFTLGGDATALPAPQDFTLGGDTPASVAPIAGAANATAPAATPSQSPADLEQQFVNSGLPGSAPSLQDETTAEINHLLKNPKAGAPDVMRYFDARGVKADPRVVEDQVANYRNGLKALIPITPQAAPGNTQSLGAGVDQGGADVGATAHNIAAWADEKLPVLGKIDQLAQDFIGIPTPDKAQVGDEADRAGFEGQYKDSTLASAGRIGGNILASAPLIAATEGTAAGALPGLLGKGAASAIEFAGGRAGTNLLTMARLWRHGAQRWARNIAGWPVAAAISP